MPTGIYERKPHSKETKKKIRIKLLGNQNGIGNKSRTGLKTSDKTKQKQREAQLEKRSHFWKGGRYKDSNGYILIMKHNHLFANKDGYVFEHRLVAEKSLGRYLTEKEVIHHINEIKDDNKQKNLYLFEASGKHLSYHFSKKNKKILLISNL